MNSTIFVPSGGIIRDVVVSLSIVHTFNADLDVSLVHDASGISAPLFADVGGSGDGIFVRLSDVAGTDIGSLGSETIVGQFNLEGTAVLLVFDGLNSTGTCRLFIDDDLIGGSVSLLSWSLHVDHD